MRREGTKLQAAVTSRGRETPNSAQRCAAQDGKNKDSNDVQLSTKCEVVDTEDVALKYTAWNWYVQTIGSEGDSNGANHRLRRRLPWRKP